MRLSLIIISATSFFPALARADYPTVIEVHDGDQVKRVAYVRISKVSLNAKDKSYKFEIPGQQDEGLIRAGGTCYRYSLKEKDPKKDGLFSVFTHDHFKAASGCDPLSKPAARVAASTRDRARDAQAAAKDLARIRQLDEELPKRAPKQVKEGLELEQRVRDQTKKYSEVWTDQTVQIRLVRTQKEVAAAVKDRNGRDVPTQLERDLLAHRLAHTLDLLKKSGVDRTDSDLAAVLKQLEDSERSGELKLEVHPDPAVNLGKETSTLGN